MSKNKRLIYISDDLIDIYDSLPNKSEFVAQKLREIGAEDVVDKSSDFEEKVKKLRGRSTANQRTE